MCGINGIITTKKNIEISTILKQMNRLITHRGPDEEGYYTDKQNHYIIGMAMTRLSIIDLQTGTQPIYNEDKSLVIVFNGEIYNYQKLRNQLVKEGVNFKTQSDTEVVLKLYEKYGKDSFRLLDGMFAFSIYDKKLNKIIIARDFFGEKPLYYTQNNHSSIWASELKSILSLNKSYTISKKGLNLFLRLTYIPAPYTIYENIHKLEANSFLEFDLNKQNFQIEKIHLDKIPDKNTGINFNEAKKQVEQLVRKSVESRSIADVPLGTFLSGGVDSSIVSLVLAQQKEQPIHTFSVGFKKKSFDETDKSRIVAKLIGSKHQEFIIGENDLKENLDKIITNFDEPFADSSALPTYMVAYKTRQFVKVALTGDGGDEVFGGYNKYYIGKINQKYTGIIPEKLHYSLKNNFQKIFKDKDDNRGLMFKINKALNAIDYQDDFYWNIISLGFHKQALNQLLLPKYQENDIFSSYKENIPIKKYDSLTAYRIIDKYLSLEGDMLVKVDRTSMLTSLETRAPFLNKELWDYTLSLPEVFLMKGNNKKNLLKKAFEQYFPKGFLEKSKKGFGVPVGDWLRSSFKNELLSYTDSKLLAKQGIFNPDFIKKLVNEHLIGKQDHTFQVWTFFVFQKWYLKIN